jgi:hypothetical protein
MNFALLSIRLHEGKRNQKGEWWMDLVTGARKVGATGCFFFFFLTICINGILTYYAGEHWIENGQ